MLGCGEVSHLVKSYTHPLLLFLSAYEENKEGIAFFYRGRILASSGQGKKVTERPEPRLCPHVSSSEFCKVGKSTPPLVNLLDSQQPVPDPQPHAQPLHLCLQRAFTSQKVQMRFGSFTSFSEFVTIQEFPFFLMF